LEALFDDATIRDLIGALFRDRAFDRTVYRRPQVLFSLPNIEAWTLPTGWHTDSPRLPSGERPGVQIFTFLEPVEAGGGGTLVVAGSHRLLNDGLARKPKDVNRLLRQQHFFRDLYAGRWRPTAQHALPCGQIGDVPLRVVELTGRPGDVWITDLRALHAPAPNAAEQPRIMVTHRFLRADLMPEIAAAYGWR
jgi:ectoine hydroxylase-related dioxygenase (phytanoyl-CoA dioxygenase family)